MSSSIIGKTRKWLLEQLMECETPQELIKKCKLSGERGILVQAIWDLIIKTGCTNRFLRSEYEHHIGSMNKRSLKKMLSFTDYLENNLNDGSSSGASDITEYNREHDFYDFITSKYLDKIRSVADFDIHHIVSAADHSGYKKYKIHMIVRNKHEVFKIAKNAKSSSAHITKHIQESQILDDHDLELCFITFKDVISRTKVEDYDDVFCGKKNTLELRFHQELTVQKIMKQIGKGQTKFLIGHMPRSGKSATLGGLLRALRQEKGRLRALILTPAPNETISQFVDDIFRKFSDFKHFKIIELNARNVKTLKIADDTIVIASKQFMQRYTKNNAIKTIKHKFDIACVDESHFGACTVKTKEIVETYSSAEAILVPMTATFQKPIQEWNIGSDCETSWTLESVQLCKTRNTKELIKQYGSIAKKLLSDPIKSEKLLTVYDHLPKRPGKPRINTRAQALVSRP
jgi:hypothetical protein